MYSIIFQFKSFFFNKKEHTILSVLNIYSHRTPVLYKLNQSIPLMKNKKIMIFSFSQTKKQR